jgi:hypothetical protein
VDPESGDRIVYVTREEFAAFRRSNGSIPLGMLVNILGET